MHNIYYDGSALREAVSEGRHRELIGGLWDEMGSHQLRFLIEQGMTPQQRLLDIGCGSLRLGVRAIEYLEAEQYFGTDISVELIDAGLDRELDHSLRMKAPRSHFAVNEDFDFSFLPKPVDVAIAQSVFTHLPLNHLRRCLAKLSPHIKPGGRFFVTYFECPAGRPIDFPVEQAPADSLFDSPIVTQDHKDPYHYRVSDLEWAAEPESWSFEPLGDWGHPRRQQMGFYVRR